MDFVDDLSTWYLRRSRDRFKDGGEDAGFALKTTREVLKTFSMIAAPFIPFTAEGIFQKVRSDTDPESVHLCEWPHVGFTKPYMWEEMKEVRRVCSLALEARFAAGIKVRQPLLKLEAGSSKLEGKKELLELIKDEVNVKEVIITKDISENEVKLDTTITDELRKEGEIRNFIRMVQDLRKQAGLMPKDQAILVIAEDAALVEHHWDEIKKTTNLSRFEKGDTTHVRKA